MEKIHTEIIPAINSESFLEVKEKIEKVRNRTRWIHIDVADRTFTENVLWHNPAELKDYLAENPDLRIEVHLMVQHPEAVVAQWIEAGAKRIIVHVETMTDFFAIKKLCDEGKVLLTLAIGPETPAQVLDEYFGQKIVCYLVLSVPPGRAGQLFMESSYDKIRYIREKIPYADIEVDGGVKPGIARTCKEAGANLFAAASAIFSHENPGRAIEELKKEVA